MTIFHVREAMLAHVTVAGGDEISDHVVFKILPVCVGVCVCVCMYVYVCVCVCVCESESWQNRSGSTEMKQTKKIRRIRSNESKQV
jgi:hypothetical protein